MKVDITNPSSNPEFEDVRGCLKNIASIPRGSIPLARGLGLNWENISEVPDDLENDYAVDAAEQFEKYEPRVALEAVTFDHDQRDGQTRVTLTFDDTEEEDTDE